MQAIRQSRYRHHPATQVSTGSTVNDPPYILATDVDGTRKYWLIAGCVAVSMLVGAGVGLVIMHSVGRRIVDQSGLLTCTKLLKSF